jgi:hypothetical protein
MKLLKKNIENQLNQDVLNAPEVVFSRKSSKVFGYASKFFNALNNDAIVRIEI